MAALEDTSLDADDGTERLQLVAKTGGLRPSPTSRRVATGNAHMREMTSRIL